MNILFFSGKLPENIHLLDIVRPDEILFFKKNALTNSSAFHSRTFNARKKS